MDQDWQAADQLFIQAYADDIVIWAAAPTAPYLQVKLQSAIARLEVWGEHHAMQFQPSKTRVITFLYRGALPSISLQMYQIPLSAVQTVRYLGFHIDARHSWLPHLRTLVPRINALACRYLPTVRACRPVRRSVARRIFVGAALPVLLYGYGVWGSGASKQGVAKLIRHIARPFLLALAHAPPTAATNILHKLVALPDVLTLSKMHTTWLIATSPLLKDLFVIPWACSYGSNARLPGQPLRSFVYSLLDQFTAEFQPLVQLDQPVAPRLTSLGRSNLIQISEAPTTITPQGMRKWRAGNWALVSWQHSAAELGSIIIHLEPPNGSQSCSVTRSHHYTTPTWLLFQFLLAFTQNTTLIQEYTREKTLLLMMQAPSHAVGRSSAELLVDHWMHLTNGLATQAAALAFTFQLYTYSDPPLHPLWRQLAKQHQMLGSPPTSTAHHASFVSLTAPQLTAKLKLRLIQWGIQDTLPHASDNKIFSALFPTFQSLKLYAATSNLSWALGQLVTDQHPLQDHLYRTKRTQSNICPVCGSGAETLEHFLFDCEPFNDLRDKWLRKWYTALKATSHKHAVQHFRHLATHTITRDTLRALDDYVVNTRRFFNKLWLNNEKTPRI